MPVFRVYPKKDNKHYFFKFQYLGKQIKKEVNPFTKEEMTKKEALVVASEYYNYLVNQGDTTKLKFYTLYKEYLDTSKGNIKKSSQKVYGIFERNYLPMLPNRDISMYVVKDFVAWRDKIIKLDNSTEYINRILNIMHKVLEYGHIIHNMPSNLQYPFLQPFNREVITNTHIKEKWIKEADFEAMMDILINEHQKDYLTLFNILYYGGLRYGECLALTTSDITTSGSNVILRINKSYSRIGSEDTITTPKTENSIRSVTLDTKTSAIVIDYIKDKQGYIFKRRGKFIGHQILGRTLKKLGAEIGLTDVELHPHILRHSHASNLLAKGWNEYQISDRLGNTPKMASTTYIHGADADINSIR